MYIYIEDLGNKDRSPRKYKEVQNMEMLNLRNIAIVIEFHNLKTCM